ncbi:MAG: hypothetical protein GC159_10060 [Phycisphaera sp.]|nr:hypothetical protein [Phycisphaera sp.]
MDKDPLYEADDGVRDIGAGDDLLKLKLAAVGACVSVAAALMGMFGCIVGPDKLVSGFSASLIIAVVLLAWLARLQRLNGGARWPRGGLSAAWPRLQRCRPWLVGTIVACGLALAGTLLWAGSAMSETGGPHGDWPIMAERATYVFEKDGVETPVTRERFVLIGSAMVVGFGMLPTLASLMALHIALYGGPRLHKRHGAR